MSKGEIPDFVWEQIGQGAPRDKKPPTFCRANCEFFNRPRLKTRRGGFKYSSNQGRCNFFKKEVLDGTTLCPEEISEEKQGE